MKNIINFLSVIISGIIVGIVVLHYEYGFLQKKEPNVNEPKTIESHTHEKKDTVFVSINLPEHIEKQMPKAAVIPKEKTDNSSTKFKEEYIVDSDKNKYPLFYHNGIMWLGKNLNLNIEGSDCYKNDEANCAKFGRLYTLKSAAKACQSLGQGWRLPTENEWKKLSKAYGGYRVISYTIDEPQEEFGNAEDAYNSLIEGGASKFNAQLGGGKNWGGSFNLNSVGYYWTSFDVGFRDCYFIFQKGNEINELLKSFSPSPGMISCRCVKKVSEQ